MKIGRGTRGAPGGRGFRGGGCIARFGWASMTRAPVGCAVPLRSLTASQLAIRHAVVGHTGPRASVCSRWPYHAGPRWPGIQCGEDTTMPALPAGVAPAVLARD